MQKDNNGSGLDAFTKSTLLPSSNSTLKMALFLNIMYNGVVRLRGQGVGFNENHCSCTIENIDQDQALSAQFARNQVL